MSEAPKTIHHISISTGTILKILLTAAIVFAIWKVSGLVLVILTAVVIASFVHGGAQTLQRLRIPRSLAVTMIYIIVFGVLATVLWLFVPILLGELLTLTKLLPEGSPVAEFLVSFQAGGGAQGFLTGLTSPESSELVSTLREQLSGGGIFKGVSSFFGGIINFIIMLVVSFYLSIEEKATENFLRIISPKKNEEYVVDVWHRSRNKISAWFKGQLLLALILAVLTYIGLTIIGVPYALMLAIMAALLSLVPYGIIIGIVPALLVGYLAGGISMIAFIALLYLLLQQFENYVLQPLIVKKVTGVPSLVVLLSVLIGVGVVGFLGLILAIPTSVIILELLHDRQKQVV